MTERNRWAEWMELPVDETLSQDWAAWPGAYRDGGLYSNVDEGRIGTDIADAGMDVQTQ